MGTQDKHDLLLRITHPGEASADRRRRREAPRRIVGPCLAAQRATKQREVKNRSRRQLGVSSSILSPTSDNVWDPWATLACLFIQPAGHKGWLACRPSQGNRPAVTCKKPRGARGARRQWMDGLFGDDSTARAFNVSAFNVSSPASRLVHINMRSS
jgi:hypothetical protein